jgi:hypothetical protein
MSDCGDPATACPSFTKTPFPVYSHAWREAGRRVAFFCFSGTHFEGLDGLSAHAGRPSFILRPVGKPLARRVARAHDFGRPGSKPQMHADPRFWAVFVAIWLGLVLAVINIAVKIHMFFDLASVE